jgi:hypothetical protein
MHAIVLKEKKGIVQVVKVFFLDCGPIHHQIKGDGKKK